MKDYTVRPILTKTDIVDLIDMFDYFKEHEVAFPEKTYLKIMKCYYKMVLMETEEDMKKDLPKFPDMKNKIKNMTSEDLARMVNEDK